MVVIITRSIKAIVGRHVIKLPFNYNDESAEFSNALISLMQKAHRKQISQYVSDDNVHKFYHGKGWVRVSNNDSEASSLQSLSVTLTIEKENILRNDASKLFAFMNEFIDGFTSQMVGNLFATASNACEKTGNVVNMSDHTSQADAFLDMLKKIEFSVDENGQVSLPSIHVGPSAAGPLIKELESQPQSFHDEVKLVKKQKSESAIEREKLRLSKFKAISFD